MFDLKLKGEWNHQVFSSCNSSSVQHDRWCVAFADPNCNQCAKITLFPSVRFHMAKLVGTAQHSNQCLQHIYEFRSANFLVRLLLQPGRKEISPNPTNPGESQKFASFSNAISSPPSTKASLCVFHPKFPSHLSFSSLSPTSKQGPPCPLNLVSSLSIPFN